MFSKLKLAAKNSIIYGLGNILIRIVGLILLPLYTDKLTTAEFGGVGIADVTCQVIITVFGLSLYRALERYYWDKEYAHKQKSIFFTILVCLIVISISTYFISLSFVQFLSILLFDTKDYTYLIQLMFISSGLNIITQYIMSLIRLQQKPILFTLSNLMRFITILVMTIILLVYFDKKIEGIYEALVLGHFVFLLSLSGYVWKNIEFRFELSALKEMMKFSAPLIASALSLVMLSSVDRYSLRVLCDFKDIGLYTLGFKLANTVKIIFTRSIELAVTPMKYKMMHEPDSKKFYSKITTYIALFVLIIVLVLSIFSKEIIEMLSKNPEYNIAHIYVPILTLAVFIDTVRRNINIGLFIKKKTNIIATAVIIMSLINLGLNFLIISLIGPFGAAIANLCTQIIFFIIIYKYSQKYYPIKYEIGKLFKLIVIASVFFAVLPLINEFNLVNRFTLKSILIVLIFPLILYYWNFFEDIEIIRAKETLQLYYHKVKTSILGKR